jgi:hypothetical protein
MSRANGEGRVTGHDAAPKTHKNEDVYFAAAVPSEQELDEGLDHFARLRTRLAANGYSLSELSCGGFLIARWNLTRSAPDLRAVRQFLRAVGGGA